MDVWQVNKSLVINTVKNMPEHGSSFQEVFCKKAVYKNFAKFIGLWHRCFPACFKEQLWCLLLRIRFSVISILLQKGRLLICSSIKQKQSSVGVSVKKLFLKISQNLCVEVSFLIKSLVIGVPLKPLLLVIIRKIAI